MIYVIGDSHVREFIGEDFQRIWIGAPTSYGLFNLNSRSQSRNKIFSAIEYIPKESSIILVTGEIDCRLHIFEQQGKMIGAIEKTVQNSLLFCKELKLMGYKVFFYNINPAGWEENIYKIEFFPTSKIRSEIYLIANRATRLLSPIYRVDIVDIFDHLVGERGILNKEYTQDGVHINELASRLFLLPEIYKVIK